MALTSKYSLCYCTKWGVWNSSNIHHAVCERQETKLSNIHHVCLLVKDEGGTWVVWNHHDWTSLIPVIPVLPLSISHGGVSSFQFKVCCCKQFHKVLLLGDPYYCVYWVKRCNQCWLWEKRAAWNYQEYIFIKISITLIPGMHFLSWVTLSCKRLKNVNKICIFFQWVTEKHLFYLL